MHWDERAYLAAGLARLLQVKYGFASTQSTGAASSSPVDTVSSADPTPDRLAAMGVQTRQEVIAE